MIEGPLGSEQARGWVHNIVLTKKKWDDKARVKVKKVGSSITRDESEEEGPLGYEQARGLVHNIVVTKKKWDEKAVRLNIDTRAMEKYAEVPHFPIPTAEQLRHKFLGSDRFTVVDLNHAFH